jgi:hypothetical protein
MGAATWRGLPRERQARHKLLPVIVMRVSQGVEVAAGPTIVNSKGAL